MPRPRGVPATHLELDVTETFAMDDAEMTVTALTALNDMGLALAIDDFGTGYSSLSYLKRFPVSYLKIDQSFVRNIGTKSADAMIIQTIIGMANNLGIEVIAEGVETHAQRDFLWGAGCMLYQGYLFGKPVPVAEFTALLT
jgi:EAL domain-containing protein (putative c-di-GMP-specific phosphodiesterase class I)